ncbi:MAG: NPCBM/NEW2 domain-containing protein [Solibacillus sp.]
MKKVLSIATAAALAMNITIVPFNVLAEQLPVESEVLTVEVSTPSNASVRKFSLLGQDVLSEYNEMFKMDNANIQAITNNGGIYSKSYLQYAIDDNLKTHWETGKPNSDTFTNEVVFTFHEATDLNRIVYAARPGGKGYAQEFEIYRSTTEDGNDFTLVTEGEYKGSVGDVIEIQFNSTQFKRLKFVYKKAHQNWASAGEFSFYKDDTFAGKMVNLFTDSSKSKVAAEFNSLQVLNELEETAQTHPLYAQYKEDIENAKALLMQQAIEATTAVTKSFNHFASNEYSQQFRMDYNNIQSVQNNGGHYSSAVIENAVDGNPTTYWETKKANTSSFSNEVEVTFKEAVTLDRIIYGARPDRKGFAEEFDIYASQTTKGDTYQLVATGKHNLVAGLVEAKFEPTTFQRVKFVFKKSNQNWATLAELAFYKQDVVQNDMDNLFTDATQSKVMETYNTLDKLKVLEEKAKLHPLYETFKEDLALAKKIVNGELATEGRIIKAEQYGNMASHSQKVLKMQYGNNNQPTGIAARAGEKITVYVDADPSGPLPQLVFTQQEGSWNAWSSTVSLKPGINEFTVPTIYNGNVTQGGPIYIVNPYTPDQQQKTPLIRIEGGEQFPIFTKTSNVDEFKAFLIDYKNRLEADVAAHPTVTERKLIDVVELVSDRIVFTGTASQAYDAYITKNFDPMATVNGYDVWINKVFEFSGLDGSSETHDPKDIRENIRLMQPYGAMYAAGNHTGIQRGTVPLMFSDFRQTYPGWGLTHEIGHRMAVGVREYPEVSNNMVSMAMSVDYNSIDSRIPYERMYSFLIEENKTVMANLGYFERLAAFWQLELAHPSYWADLNDLYRERTVALPDGDLSKQQYLIQFSSEVLQKDLSSYFARHGYTVTDETKKIVSKYDTPKKYWYLNNSVIQYEGDGFTKEAAVTLNSARNEEKQTNTLTFAMDDANKQHVLGYEIIRNGEIIGFTATTSFVDQTVDVNENYTYEVIAYDKKLNSLSSVQTKAFKPTLLAAEQLTVKLNQTLNLRDYVKAFDYKGNDITENIEVTSTVDSTKNGNYEVVYTVKSNGITEQKKMNVTVTSDYTYASDMNPESTEIAWGTYRKDQSPASGTIGLLRQGMEVTYEKGIGAHASSEIVYNIEGKDFDFFESYIGIDQAMRGSSAPSATFEVWVDDEKKYESGLFKATTESEFVKVAVTGAKVVKLMTKDAGNNASDHTVWADAKFTKNESKPVIHVADDFTMVKLHSDFDLLEGVQAFDVEDGDLLTKVNVTTNGFTPNKSGLYEVDYAVTDQAGNTVTKTREIYVYSNTTYATDIDWKSATTAWKSVMKDSAQAGGKIKLFVNGQTQEFEKGIGTHANSEIVYDLENKNLDFFETLVGIERGIGQNNTSSVTFKVLADGQEVFNSGVMKYNTEAKHVRIPLAGVKELKLIANDGGYNGSDHAAFADAKFYYSNGLPELIIPPVIATKVGEQVDLNGIYKAIDAEDGDLTSHVQVTGIENVNFNQAGKYEISYSVTDSEGNTVTKTRTVAVVNMEDYSYLSDFDWSATQNSYKAPVKDKALSGNSLKLTTADSSQVEYKKGIGAHSKSTIIYNLTDKDVAYFTSFVGVERSMYNTVGSVVFQVYVDGEKKFDSGLMTAKVPQQFVEVNLVGAKELKLVVTDGGNGNGSDHAAWGDAKLHFANPTTVR